MKKLQIYGIQEDYIRKDKVFHDLCCLNQLTELKFNIRKMIGSAIYDTSFVLPPLGAFPKNLKKLAFTGMCLHWEDLEILGKLPKLEALKLGYDACIGKHWEVEEEGFPHLKVLRLKQLYLHNWRASSDQFPRLERLVINRCWSMYSIPEDFVDAFLLRMKKKRDLLFNRKIWSCRSSISPEFVDCFVRIYNGKTLVRCKITEGKVRHKFGEFASTRK